MQSITFTKGMGSKNHPTKEVYTAIQTDYLRKRFNIGRDTEVKQDPSTVAKEMGRAKDADGNRLFPSSKEFLTSQQITSFFSRLASRYKGALAAEQELNEEAEEDGDGDHDNGDEDENAYSARQEKTMEDMRILATKEASATLSCTTHIIFANSSPMGNSVLSSMFVLCEMLAYILTPMFLISKPSGRSLMLISYNSWWNHVSVTKAKFR